MFDLETKTMMIINIAIGSAILYYAFELQKTCSNDNVNVHRALQGLTVIGTALITVSATHLTVGCAPTNTKVSTGFLGKYGYIILLILLSATLVGLSSTVKSGCSGYETTKLLVLSILALVGSSGYLAYDLYKAKKGSTLFSNAPIASYRS